MAYFRRYAYILPKTARELGGLSCIKVPGVNGLKDRAFAAVKREGCKGLKEVCERGTICQLKVYERSTFSNGLQG